MPNLFPKKNIIINSGGSSGVGGTSSLSIKDSGFKFTVGSTETNNVQSTSESFVLNVTVPEALASKTESNKLSLSGTAFNDANASILDVKNTFIRHWATTAVDNDSDKTVPANMIGANNSTFCTVKTNNSLADLTNPVTATASVFGNPTTGTYTTKKIRIFFKVPARLVATDIITIVYNTGGGNTTLYTHSGTALVDNSISGDLYDVSSLTLTNLSSLNVIGSYTSTLVASPETSLQIDAVAIELEGGI